MAATRRLNALLRPGRIGELELRNRIAMTPMGSNLALPTGHVGERIIRYYEERARGGVGLVIVGVGAISYPDGTCLPNQVSASADDFLPGLEELAARVHRHGAKIAIQLQHAGKVATMDMAAGRPMLVPSTPTPKLGDIMKDMTESEAELFTRNLRREGAGIFYREASEADLADVVTRFAEAAKRVQRAGFDAVELHAGHGYLLSSFLSPASNRRTDRYGGSLENRARLLVETLRAAKEQTGSSFPIWCRLDAVEFRTPGGIVFEDAVETARRAEAAGADAIHVSAYADATSGVAFTDAPLVHKPSGYVEFAAGIKRAVEIPVIAVGRIEPAEAERLIVQGKADFIAMGRKLLADPELPNKLAQNRAQDVRPCIYCYTCVGEIFLNRPSRCAVNPASGREAEFEMQPAKSLRHVLVVGGGPAGMEVARVAALRGHRVTLCERSPQLGGTAFLSALVYPPNGALVSYLEGQLRALPVEIRLGVEVTPTFVRERAPDVVIVAVGARRERPDLPGVDARHVLSGDDLRELLVGGGSQSGRQRALRKLTLVQRALLKMGDLAGVSRNLARIREATKRWMPLGKRVAILGGGLVGVELAEFLSVRGRQVTVIEEGGKLAPEMAMPRRWRILYELREQGVDLRCNTRVTSIASRCVSVVDAQGRSDRVPADTVLLALGARANPDLADALERDDWDVRTIGDAAGVGYIDGAIRDGVRTGLEL